MKRTEYIDPDEVLIQRALLRRRRALRSQAGRYGQPLWIAGAIVLLVLLGLLLAPSHAGAAIALNPDVTPDTIRQTICVPGWTATVRPPVSFTNRIKHALMVQAGLPLAREHEFELDHHVPLALGGHPSSPDNLWLQAWEDHPIEGWSGEISAKVKDKLEVRLKNAVCSGAMPLSEAQACIYDDWRACALKHSPKGTP